jgi:tRNA threonylcarbamoyl adenosine modification protein YeaZ
MMHGEIDTGDSGGSGGPGGPCILAIDASGDQASVALWRDDHLCAAIHHPARHGHAATLIPLAQEMMQDQNLGFDALTHVAGGRGPGSFTGIRVALSAAKGLCLATGAVPIGISILAANAAMAVANDVNQGRHMVILADTRRGPLYAQLFDPTGRPLDEIFEAEPDQIIAQIKDDIGPLAIAGPNGNELNIANRNGDVMMDNLPAPDAGQIAALAAAQIADATSSFAQLTPLYLAPAFLGPKRS